MISSSPSAAPMGGTAASADVVATGLPIPPIERIRIFTTANGRTSCSNGPIRYAINTAPSNGDVKDAFCRSIAENLQFQVIIFENEDPPSDLGSDANIIQFTGASFGRQGFIPKNV